MGFDQLKPEAIAGSLEWSRLDHGQAIGPGTGVWRSQRVVVTAFGRSIGVDRAGLVDQKRAGDLALPVVGRQRAERPTRGRRVEVQPGCLGIGEPPFVGGQPAIDGGSDFLFGLGGQLAGRREESQRLDLPDRYQVPAAGATAVPAGNGLLFTARDGLLPTG